jgi:hypothetical protein
MRAVVQMPRMVEDPGRSSAVVAHHGIPALDGVYLPRVLEMMMTRTTSKTMMTIETQGNKVAKMQQ